MVVLLGHQRKAEPLRAGAALPTQGGLSTSTHPTAPLFRSQRTSTALAASRAPCPHGSMLAGAGPVPTGCHPPSAWWQSRLPLPNTTSPLAACRMKTTTTWRPAARAALHRRRSRAPTGRRRTVHPATAAAPRRAWLTPPCDATSARVPHIELFHLFFFFYILFSRFCEELHRRPKARCAPALLGAVSLLSLLLPMTAQGTSLLPSSAFVVKSTR